MRWLLLLVLLLSLMWAPYRVVAAGETSAVGEVLVLQLYGTVDYGMVRYVQRGIKLANQRGVKGVVLEIDTLGGRVDAALDIRDAVNEYQGPSAALVKGRAWSAGVLLALAPQKLFMQSGSSIGSAEVRPLEEKTLSAWRAELEAAAESRGKDPKVAAAMADASLEIPGLVDKGKLLNLTAAKAKEIGFADSVVGSIDQVVEAMGLEGAPVEVLEWSAAEKVARFATDPIISPILLAVGIGGLFVEAMMPGFGLPGLIGLISLVLFFGGRAMAGLTAWSIVGLFLVGLVLLTIEAFIPGFGVFGITGIVCVAVSIYLAGGAGAEALRSVVIAVVLTVLLAAAVGRFAFKRGLWARISLNEAVKGTTKPVDKLESSLLGAEGVCLTPLRPAGIAEVRGQRVDVITPGDFLERGTRIRVVRIDGTKVIVVPLKEESANG
ncbi:MAG: NfeD family protein [Bacillota bacterium]